MQPNPTITTAPDNRQAARSALAVVGFVALVTLGIYLAIYSARYVPSAVGRLGSAAVALSSLFTPAASSSLAVIPASVASTTISFGTTTAPVVAPVPKLPTATPEPGAKTSGVYSIGGTAPASYSGLPDLVVTINQVGYLATNSTDSFVAATVVPHGDRPAVKFTVKNVGTNVAGPWRFSAAIPTQVGYNYQSLTQQSLNPGDSIDYTLGFDQASIGTNESITIVANFDHAVAESNTNNDSATATITVQ